MQSATMHHYPARDLVGDYIRGLVGVAICGTPLVLAGGLHIAGIIMGFLTLLFAGFILRTALRHYARISVDDEGLKSLGLRQKKIAWTEIRKVKMRYYSTKRDRTEGWMQIKINGKPGTVIEMDSLLTDFESIIQKLGPAAVRARAMMDETTRANFALMGIDLVELANGEPEETLE